MSAVGALLVAVAVSLAAEPGSAVSTVEEARRAVQAGDPGRASRIVLGLYSTDDPVTVAERGAVAEQAIEVLEATIRSYRASGATLAALRDADARWLLSGRVPSSEYGRELLDYSHNLAREDRPGEAAYVALRALAVDPGAAAARRAARRYTGGGGERTARRFAVAGGVSLVLAGAAAVSVEQATRRLEDGGRREDLDRSLQARRWSEALTYAGIGGALGSGVAATVSWRWGAGPVVAWSPEPLPAWEEE